MTRRLLPSMAVLALLLVLPARAATPIAPTVVVDGIPWPISLQPHGTGLVASLNYPYGEPQNFVQIDSNGTVSDFSALHGLMWEVELAQKGPGAPYVFNRTDVAGTLGTVSVDGATITPVWKTLPGETTPARFPAYGSWLGASGFFVLAESGNLWAQQASGAFGLLATFPRGVETLGFVPEGAKYGPLSGAVVATGAVTAALTYENHRRVVRTYPHFAGIPGEIEQLAVVPANRNFYLPDYYHHQIWGFSAADLAAAGLVGELIAVTEEHPANVYHVWWDGAAFQSEVVCSSVDNKDTFEVGVFTKNGIGSIPAVP